MKISMIYKKYIDFIVNETQTSLYGFTKSKKLIKEFKEERDMNLFVILEKHISEEEYVDFSIKSNDMEIKYYDLYTKGFASNKKRIIQVLSNWNELEASHIHGMDLLIHELSKYMTSRVYSLKDKYIDALNVLSYMVIYSHCYKVKSSFMDGFYLEEDGTTRTMDDLFHDIDCDEYALYLYFYGNTYKISRPTK